MVGRRQARERRLQLGEALISGGLVVLVVTPIVYRVHAASKHVRATRSMLWPTPLMILPLLAVVAGAVILFELSGTFTARRSARRRARRRSTSAPPAVDLPAEEAREAAAAENAAADRIRTAYRPRG